MNTTTQRIAVGVAVVVLGGIILAGIRSCRWMHDTIIKLEERVNKD